MQMEDILTPERCFCSMEAISKKRILKTVSELIEQNVSDLPAPTVFNALMDREQLGSTGLGNGIAIPHCKIEECKEIIGVLLTLKDPVDFDAIDGKPVDLIFVLVVPDQKTDEHVRTLGKIAELFNDEQFCYILRNTHHGDDLYNVAITY
jgi:nitrogen PTS system EIIA component